MAQLEPESMERDERLGEAIEEYLALAETGEAPEPEIYAERFPEFSQELREALDGLALVQGLVGDSGAGGRPLEAGRRVAGYRIVRELGRGGMGVVYEAVHVDLDRPVALKVLGMHATPDSTGRARFLNEAKTAASLHHTYIVPVFDVGQVGGLCYYAMQRIEGAGLDRVVKALRGDRSSASGSTVPRRSSRSSKAPTPPSESLNRSIECLPVDENDLTASFLDWSESSSRPARLGRQRAQPSPYTPPRGSAYFRWVAQFGRQAAEALAYAHKRGVVHRDIKPSNLLVDGRGNIWVSDFGLARRLEGDPGLTHSGVPIGTPRYMSPEQASAGAVDARTDVYSLGATLYELLTLRPPFDGTSTPELLQQILHKEPIAPRRLDARIPRDLETIVLKAMAKRPADRYASAQALCEDIDRFLNFEPLLARRIGPVGRTWRFARRHPYSSTISLLAASIVIAVATWAHMSVVRERNEALAANSKTARALAQAEQEKRRANLASAEAHWLAATVARGSKDPDRRRQARESLTKAAKLYPTTDLVVKLRDEAAASLSLRDVQMIRSLRTGKAAGTTLTSDGRWLATLDADGQHIALRDLRGQQSDRLIPLSDSTEATRSEIGRWWSALVDAGDRLLYIDPNDHRVYSIGYDGSARRELPFGERMIDGLLIADGGRRLVTIERLPLDSSEPQGRMRGPAGGRFVLWDLASLESGPLVTLAEFRRGSWFIPRIAIAPNGRTIAVATNIVPEGAASIGGVSVADSSATITLFDPHSGLAVGRIERLPSVVSSLAVGPSGNVAAALQNGTIQFWDESQTLRPGFYHDMPVSVMRFSANGSILAVTGWGAPTVQLYDTTSNELIATVRTADRVQDLMFAPNAQMLAAVVPNAVTMWNIVEPVGQIRLANARPMSVSFANDGALILGTRELGARRWNPGHCPESFVELAGPHAPFVTIDRDGWLDACTPEGLERWPLDGSSHALHVAFPGSPTYSRVESRRGTPRPPVPLSLVAGTAVVAQPLSIETIAVSLGLDVTRRSFSGVGRGVLARPIVRSPDGSVLVIMRNEEPYIWTSSDPGRLRRVEGINRALREAGFRGGSGFGFSTVAATSDLTRLFVLQPDGRFYACSLSDDGDQLTASLLPWSRRVLLASCMKLHPDGEHLALGGRDGSVRLIDNTNGQVVTTVLPADPAADGAATSIAFGPDRMMAVGTQHGRIAIWSLRRAAGAELLLHLPGDEGSVNAVEFQPSAHALASISGDVVHLWNINRVRDELQALGLGW